jgi:hypothetical protein
MEKYNNLIEKYGHFKNFPEYEKTKKICLIALKKDDNNIIYIKNQSLKIKKYVCSNYGPNIYHIHGTTLNLFKLACKNYYKSFVNFIYCKKYYYKNLNKYAFFIIKINILIFDLSSMIFFIRYKLHKLKKNLSYFIF